MSDTPLLPCPFCGGKPTLINAAPKQSPPFYVLCKGRISGTPCNAQVWPSDTAEKAIANWNTRAHQPTTSEDVKTLLHQIRSKFHSIKCSNSIVEAFNYAHEGQELVDRLAAHPTDDAVRDRVLTDAMNAKLIDRFDSFHTPNDEFGGDCSDAYWAGVSDMISAIAALRSPDTKGDGK